MDAHRKGDLTAAIVVAELKRRGIPVSRPIGDNERYDLIAESQEDLWKLQVKTGRLGNSVIRFSGSSQHTNTRDHTYDQYDDDVDYFLVYCDDLAELYLVPERKVGYRMQLRVNDPEQQDSSITWAKTYQFDNIWPPGERVTSVTAASTVMLDHLNEYDIPLYLPSHCGVSMRHW